jgi:hypothetical protein
MLGTNLERRICLACLTAALAAFRAGAADGGLPASAWEVKVRRVEGPDVLPTTWANIAVGTNQFAVNVPDGFRYDPSPSGEGVTLVSLDYAKVIVFRIFDSAATEDKTVDSSACKEALLGRFAGAKVLSESSERVGGSFGPCIELQWTGPSGVAQRGRFIFCSSRAGVLEFSITCRPEKWGEAQTDLTPVLSLFRQSDPQGIIKLPVLSNKL